MSAFQTVFVDATRRPHREVARDARDPFEEREAIESLALVLSARGRLIRVFATGLYVQPWRKKSAVDALYEAFDGQPTADFRPA